MLLFHCWQFPALFPIERSFWVNQLDWGDCPRSSSSNPCNLSRRISIFSSFSWILSFRTKIQLKLKTNLCQVHFHRYTSSCNLTNCFTIVSPGPYHQLTVSIAIICWKLSKITFSISLECQYLYRTPQSERPYRPSLSYSFLANTGFLLHGWIWWRCRQVNMIWVNRTSSPIKLLGLPLSISIWSLRPFCGH